MDEPLRRRAGKNYQRLHCRHALPWGMRPTPLLPALRRLLPALLPVLSLALLQGCALPRAPAESDAAWRAQLDRWPAVDALLLGEQHDAAAHQRWQEDTVRWLAARGRLAAVVIEMADAGTATDGLPPHASAEQVRAALRWNEAAWPWERYAPVVMAAVAAGVPVRGGNLPRERMRAAMRDEALDAHLPPAALARQREAIDAGHCGLLPADRLAPMVRVQLARDASLAQTLLAARQNGRTVLLVAGYGHARRGLGVPTWLPTDFTSKVAIAQAGQAQETIKSEADYIHHTPALPPQDPCTDLRARWPGSATQK